MPGMNFESPISPEGPKKEMPPAMVPPQENNKPQAEFKKRAARAADQIKLMAIHWGMPGGKILKTEENEILKIIDEEPVATKSDLIDTLTSEIENFPGIKDRDKKFCLSLFEREKRKKVIELGEEEEPPADWLQ
ncbi:MAG: hypothetical protein AAB692_04905 [Patescibacteria group bacterium]